MGLLNAIFSAGDSAKRRIRGLLADPVGSMQQSLDQAFPTRYEAQNALSQLRGQTYNPDALQAYNAKLDSAAMNFAPMGMTVWHGSPHKFSKFDMSKIGTGEGAQAYGHGLYMAESPVVATEYQQAVSNAKAPELYRARSTQKGAQNDIDQITGWLNGSSPWPNNTRGQPVSREFLEKRLKEYQDDAKWANDVIANREENGILYKVDIPDEAVARFLDWDKPLSQQAPEVQKAIENSPYAMRDMAMMITGNKDPLGGELVKTVMKPEEFASHLRQQGIPGIRYLDGGSRNTAQRYIAKHPQGGENVFNTQAELDAFVKRNPEFKAINPNLTSNYVLFDDQMPRILETNGVPTGLQPWKPNEWQGLLGGGR